jgi:hypothetical protein
MPQSSFSIVAKNVRAWRIFGTNKRNIVAAARQTQRAYSIISSARDKCRWQVEAERLGGLQIDAAGIYWADRPGWGPS